MLGYIPVGKVGVRVSLEASADLDIQLYDVDMNATYTEGKVVVGWCETPCNIGYLSGSS
jgi:hypothetical protein